MLLGIWELAHPVFGTARYTLTPVSRAQLWTYGLLQALKPAGFVAGLFGLFLVGTRRGTMLKLIMALAAAGGVFFAIVWIMIAVTGRDDAIYIYDRAVGSDAYSNGGVLFLWLAPVAVGVAGLAAHRMPRWKSMWAIGTGVLGSRIYGLFPPGIALIVEGVMWLVLGQLLLGEAPDKLVSKQIPEGRWY